MEKYLKVFSIVIAVTGLILIIRKLYSLYRGYSNLRNFLMSQYQKDGIHILKMKKLNLTERIKYGEPPLSIYKVFNIFSTFYNTKIYLLRRIELKDNKDNEFIRYVEVNIKNGNVISLNEFDSYNL